MKKVEEPKLPEVDADFARSLGVADGDLAKMRAEVRANVEREVKKRLGSELKEKVMQALLDDAPRLELPEVAGRDGGRSGWSQARAPTCRRAG